MAESATTARKKPFYRTLWGQVLIGVAIGVILGYVRPGTAVAMKPLGDAFIRVISMIITLVIFCTIVTGIAGMGDLKKVGRVGGKALLYFEVVSTVALFMGLIVGNLVPTGAGFNANPATLDAKAVVNYAGQAKAQTVADFLMHIIPTTVVDAFARGDILEVVFVSVLFGLAMAIMGKRVKPLVDVIEGLTQAVFGVVNIVMKAAPIGAFGAMAFTIGAYGLKSLGPLAKLVSVFWITSILFVLVVLGAICWASGFGIIRFLALHQGRDRALPHSELFRAGAAHIDGENGELGLLQGAGRLGRAHRLHLQHRWQQHLYDLGRAFRRPSHQHSPHLRPAIDHICRGRAHLQGRQRRAGRVLHRPRRHAHGHSHHSRRRHGFDSGRGPLHEHGPSYREHDR